MEKDMGNSLHIVVLPWLGFSHLNPFFELSRRITQLGHRVSFVSTHPNIDRLSSSYSGHSSGPSPLLRLVPVVGDDLDSLEEPVADFLRQTSPPPDWILFDFHPYWAARVAAQFGARCVLVSLIGAAANAFMWPTMSAPSRPEPDELTIPPAWVPFETSLAYKAHEAQQVLNQLFAPDASGLGGHYRIRSSITGCDAVAMRSCAELEGEWLRLLPRLYDKPVLALGHFAPAASSHTGAVSAWEAEAFAWLGRQQPGSVVYVACGSELYLSREQVHELAHGLELSGLPFIWALRSPSEEKADGLPSGFEERTRGRGLVWKGWAPQVRILGHGSVGGFLTHCGWNSIVEALQFGLPLVLFPLANDEGLNARLLAERRVGVEIPRNDGDGAFAGGDVARALRLVMVEDEGKEVRERAKELKGVVGREELHERYVREFVEYLKENRPIRKGD